MGNPYLGEIRMVGFNFPPPGWEFCNGQLLSIAENDALFALIGTTYGGDGQSTFGLPDLRSRVAVNLGTDPSSGNTYSLAQSVGSEMVTLNTNQLGPHTHPFSGSTGVPTTKSPAGAYPASGGSTAFFTPDTSSPVSLAANSTTPMGGSQPHSNIMPFQCISFMIATQGIFPSQG